MLAAAQVVQVIAALVNVPLFAGRVYTSRRWPLADLPAARVYASDEPVSSDIADVPMEQHDLEIHADLYIKDVDTLDQEMDAAASTVLSSVMGTRPYQLTLAGIDRQLTTDGDASVGLITLRLSAQFFVLASQPETILST